MNKLLVSIVTASYNAAAYLPETVASVQAQTYPNWEWWIVDDGSTDDTAEVVKQLAEKDDRIHYLWQENGRQGKARNLGVQHAKGEWIAFLDADDLWLPEKLAQQLKIAVEKGAGLVYTALERFRNSDGAAVERVKAKPLVSNGAATPLFALLNSNPIGLSTVLVQKQLLYAAGGFPEQRAVQNAEDYGLWLGLAAGGTLFCAHNQVLVRYRMHDAQVTSADKTAFPQAIILLKEWVERLPLTPAQRQQIAQSWLLKLAVLPAPLRQQQWMEHKPFFLQQLPRPGILPLFQTMLGLPNARLRKALICRLLGQ